VRHAPVSVGDQNSRPRARARRLTRASAEDRLRHPSVVRNEPGASGDGRLSKERRRRASPSIAVAALLLACGVARKHSPNLCKNDTVVFLERPRSALLMKLLSAATALQLAGYKPARVVGERHLDAAQAQRMSCPDCGAHGLRYTSYERASGSAHRGLAWCPECLTTVEL
jgi:hypothetical protein